MLTWLVVVAICLIPAALAARWWAGRVERERQARLRQLAKAPVDARSPRDAALAGLEKAAQERPWDPDTWYWLGDRFARLGHNPESVTAFARAAALNPRSAADRAALGLAMAKAGRPLDGEVQLREAMRLEPKLAFAHFALGSVYYQGQQWEMASDQLKQAMALDANDLESRYLLALCYEKLYLEDKKLELLEDLVKRSPDDIRFLKSLGYVYLFFGKFAEGEALYRRILKMAPDDQETHYLLGRALAEQASTPEDFAAAERELTAVEARAPTQPGVHVALGILYFRRNDAPKAIAEFERARLAGTTETKTLLYEGQAYMRAGRTAEGKATLAAFEHVSRITRTISQQENRIYSLPEDTPEHRREKNDVRLRLAKVYMEDGQYGNALRHLQALHAAEPDNAEVAKLAAVCDSHLRSHAKAGH